GASERAAFALADLLHATSQVAEVEDLMVGMLRALGYADLARTVPGLSEVGAAAPLKQLWVFSHRRAWDPVLASGIEEVVPAA
ncbi:MAG TPA: hypothetical protein VNO79_17415, partial [Actinomycetota bacterium]|nr:hypothetical protein [Actinomycetota bacterium]